MASQLGAAAVGAAAMLVFTVPSVVAGGAAAGAAAVIAAAALFSWRPVSIECRHLRAHTEAPQQTGHKRKLAEFYQVRCTTCKGAPAANAALRCRHCSGMTIYYCRDCISCGVGFVVNTISPSEPGGFRSAFSDPRLCEACRPVGELVVEESLLDQPSGRAAPPSDAAQPVHAEPAVSPPPAPPAPAHALPLASAAAARALPLASAVASHVPASRARASRAASDSDSVSRKRRKT